MANLEGETQLKANQTTSDVIAILVIVLPAVALSNTKGSQVHRKSTYFYFAEFLSSPPLFSLTLPSNALILESHYFRSSPQRAAFCHFAISNSSSHITSVIATMLFPNWSGILKDSIGRNAHENKILFLLLACFFLFFLFPSSAFWLSISFQIYSLFCLRKGFPHWLCW